jgi:hypothetical protein
MILLMLTTLFRNIPSIPFYIIRSMKSYDNPLIGSMVAHWCVALSIRGTSIPYSWFRPIFLFSGERQYLISDEMGL